MSDQRPRSAAQAPTAIARHGRLKNPHPVLAAFRFLAIALAVVGISATSIVAIEAYNFTSGIDTIVLAGDEDAPPPDIGAMEGGFNILIVGADNGPNEIKDGRGSATLNDVTMILHVSQDHTNAVAVSIPRDMVVPIPNCPKADGSGNYARMSGQPINVTLSYGGLPCTVLTVEALTGLDITFAGMISFSGVTALSNAVGGVPVCLAEGITDKYSGFSRPAGEHVLQGAEALAFLRSRHAVGDGSDLTRISSQQVFLSSLVRTLKSSETLTDVSKLYSIANAAKSTMQLSSNLANLDTMVSIAKALNDLPLEQVTFVQYPSTTGQPGIYAGKVAPIPRVATLLFDKIKADEPFALAAVGDGNGSVINPNATAAPVETPAPTSTADPTATAAPPAVEVEVIAGIKGQTAADQTCSVGR